MTLIVLLMHKVLFEAILPFRRVSKKIKTIFCILLGKIEGNLEKYHILILNMSINSYSLPYNLGLIEFKGHNTPTSLSIPFSNLGLDFKKVAITCSFGQNC